MNKHQFNTISLTKKNNKNVKVNKSRTLDNTYDLRYSVESHQETN
jgi:hypothetical protein